MRSAGRRIGTLAQSFAFDVLRQRGFEPVSYEGVSEPYGDLALGRLSGVLLDHVIADRYGCPRSAWSACRATSPAALT